MKELIESWSGFLNEGRWDKETTQISRFVVKYLKQENGEYENGSIIFELDNIPFSLIVVTEIMEDEVDYSKIAYGAMTQHGLVVVFQVGYNRQLNMRPEFIYVLKDVIRHEVEHFKQRTEDPERYGVVTIDKKYNIKSIIEKPKKTNSNIAVIGLYFFTNDVLEKVKNIRPSIRGELEIVDLIKQYLISKKLKLNMLNRKFKWFDTGTFDSILEASRYISYSQKRKIL